MYSQLRHFVTMKRAYLAQIMASIIIILVLMLPLVTMVEAAPWFNFKPKTAGLYVYQPESSHVYLMDPSCRIIFFYAMEDNQTQISFFYSLDDKESVPLPATLLNYYLYYYAVSHSIENLTDGEHTLTVYAHCSNGTISTLFTRAITVDVAANTPIVISPVNQATYNTKEVPLIYSIDKEILWSYYSIDSSNNSDLRNFDGNITLPSLSDGQHKLTLAITTNHTSIHQTIQTIIFSIDTEAPSPTVPECPTTILLATILAVVSLLLIIAKRKHTVTNHKN
ncbi:MAG: hypothetical protein ACM3UN_00960 [Bacillota bacterium]|jgi:hypothetical protein